MDMRIMAFALALGVHVAAVGCAHSTRSDSWKLSRTERGEPERSVNLEVTARGGAKWTLNAEALEARREWQVWSVQRRDFFAGSLQDSREVFVNVPDQPDDPPEPGDPSEKDLPPELAKKYPRPISKPEPKQDVQVRCEWRFEGVKHAGSPLRGECFGQGSIDLSPEQMKSILRELRLKEKVQLVVTASPMDWGAGNRLEQQKTIEVTEQDLVARASQGPAKPAPKPPAKGTAAKKGTTQARPPRTGGGSGQP